MDILTIIGTVGVIIGIGIGIIQIVDYLQKQWGRRDQVATKASAAASPNDNAHSRLVQFSKQMAKVFTLEELFTLCSDLDVTYDELPHSGLTPKIWDLIGLMRREDRLLDLREDVSRMHPERSWPTLDDLQAVMPPGDHDNKGKRGWIAFLPIVITLLSLGCILVSSILALIFGQSPFSTTNYSVSWRGKYFDNAQLQGIPNYEEDNTTIDFDWNINSPSNIESVDGFSVQWEKCLEFEEGWYIFEAMADDQLTAWLDDEIQLISVSAPIGETKVIHAREYYVSGGHHCLKVEFREFGGFAYAYFSFRTK